MCASIMESRITRLILIIHQISNWKCYHLDHTLVFASLITNGETYIRTPDGYYAEDTKGNNAFDQHYLNLIKNCYNAKGTTANQFNILLKALETYRFNQHANIDSCLFTRDNCIIIAHVDD